MLAAECEGDTGQPLLADALQAAVGSDGSDRIVEILRTCDVEFVGAIDQALGRPTTNVEALIADPANNVTPNQAQTDLLNAELAVYWRIADAWALSQPAPAGVTTTTVAGAPATTSAGVGACLRRVHLGTRGVFDHGRLTHLRGAPGSECRLGFRRNGQAQRTPLRRSVLF